ncbi:hypothetical protein [Pseudomonas sp. McL0111]|uniref:hypothetical protein n=1 Tax=Pseudomonas sp. McL0111 TaxID=3457357 RepID=UPI00403EC445
MSLNLTDTLYISIDGSMWGRMEAVTNWFVIGLTDFALGEVGDIKYLNYAAEFKPGMQLREGDVAFELESVKSSIEFQAKVSGTVKDVNIAYTDHPELMGQHAENNRWMFKVEVLNSKLSSQWVGSK